MQHIMNEEEYQEYILLKSEFSENNKELTKAIQQFIRQSTIHNNTHPSLQHHFAETKVGFEIKHKDIPEIFLKYIEIRA